jgi:transposase
MAERVVMMATRSRRTKIPAEEKTRIVVSVLAGEMTCAEAARRIGVSSAVVTKWKHQFLAAGAERLEEVPGGPAGKLGTPEQRRLRMENEQLKLALAEATVQLRIWQRGAVFADQVPSAISKP